MPVRAYFRCKSNISSIEKNSPTKKWCSNNGFAIRKSATVTTTISIIQCSNWICIRHQNQRKNDHLIRKKDLIRSDNSWKIASIITIMGKMCWRFSITNFSENNVPVDMECAWEFPCTSSMRPNTSHLDLKLTLSKVPAVPAYTGNVLLFVSARIN